MLVKKVQWRGGPSYVFISWEQIRHQFELDAGRSGAKAKVRTKAALASVLSRCRNTEKGEEWTTPETLGSRLFMIVRRRVCSILALSQVQ